MAVVDTARTEAARGLHGRVNVSGWLVVVLLVLLAEVAVRLFDLHDTVAAPSATLAALAESLASGPVLDELATTLGSYVQGLAVAIALGVVGGVAIGSSRMLGDATFVVLEVLRAIPAVALIPLASFGLGVPMVPFVVAYAAVWPVFVTTLYGVRGTDSLLHDVARTSGTTRLGAFVFVTVPGALPSIVTGIRIAAAVALLAAVTAEFVTGNSGIGAYMQQQRNALEPDDLYAAVVLVGALGYGIGFALQAASRRFVFWAGEAREEPR